MYATVPTRSRRLPGPVRGSRPRPGALGRVLPATPTPPIAVVTRANGSKHSAATCPGGRETAHDVPTGVLEHTDDVLKRGAPAPVPGLPRRRAFKVDERCLE